MLVKEFHPPFAAGGGAAANGDRGRRGQDSAARSRRRGPRTGVLRAADAWDTGSTLPSDAREREIRRCRDWPRSAAPRRICVASAGGTVFRNDGTAGPNGDRGFMRPVAVAPAAWIRATGAGQPWSLYHAPRPVQARPQIHAGRKRIVGPPRPFRKGAWRASR